MSRTGLPKQLIPFINGKSLLQISFERLDPLVDARNRWICAGISHAAPVAAALPEFAPDRFLGEPTGRDTLNAVGLGAAVIAREDPDAVIAVFTADHLIQPLDVFQSTVDHGFRIAEENARTLVTFGITPTHPATGFGYLELGDALDGSARVVREFREKPALEVARSYFESGPSRYLWNSGMFVWRAATLLECIRRFAPENYAGLMEIAAAWGTPKQEATLAEIFPTLKKISVDFAIMEPASRDAEVRVAAVPMPLSWLDVGSWPAFAETCPADAQGNAAGNGKSLLVDTRNTLAASEDADHLIATIGCDDLIIIHTPRATLVCKKDRAEQIKDLHRAVAEKFGSGYV